MLFSQLSKTSKIICNDPCLSSECTIYTDATTGLATFCSVFQFKFSAFSTKTRSRVFRIRTHRQNVCGPTRILLFFFFFVFHAYYFHGVRIIIVIIIKS